MGELDLNVGTLLCAAPLLASGSDDFTMDDDPGDEKRDILPHSCHLLRAVRHRVDCIDLPPQLRERRRRLCQMRLCGRRERLLRPRGLQQFAQCGSLPRNGFKLIVRLIHGDAASAEHCEDALSLHLFRRDFGKQRPPPLLVTNHLGHPLADLPLCVGEVGAGVVDELPHLCPDGALHRRGIDDRSIALDTHTTVP
jgi:hypothetical protein